MLRPGLLAIVVAGTSGTSLAQAPVASQDVAASEVPVGPSVPPPRRVVEVGESPVYYRQRRDTLGWGYRVGLGASLSLASALARPRSRFTLDVLPEFDVGFARGSRWGALFEGGYSYTTGGTHLLVVGGGPALRRFGPKLLGGRTGSMTAALLGHGVVGSMAGKTATGARASVLLHLWLIGVEVGYQYVQAGAQRGHELRLMLDLGVLAEIGR